ncbi:Peptide methionine sulfoxide reductase B5 [Savitreella phatthalungensis]
MYRTAARQALRGLHSTTATLASPKTKPIPTLAAGLFAAFFGSSSSSANDMTKYPVQKSDQEWRAVLSPEQFRVLRQKGTEAPGSSPIEKQRAQGIYHCAGCDAPLYKSESKFDSGCGWPAYFETIPGAVDRHEDNSMFMKRTEIVCHNCGGHLGHVFFNEGFKNPTNERHCVNGVSLKFKEK